MAGNEAVVQHVGGNYQAALDMNLAALADMGPDDPLRPGTTAAAALQYERLGEYDNAIAYARGATTWREAVSEPAEATALRLEQRPSTDLNAAVVMMRHAARGRLIKPGNRHWYQNRAGELMDAARGGIADQRIGLRPHQHAINALGRASMIEAVRGRGHRIESFGYAIGAILIGAASESPALVQHATPNLSVKERLMAKGRAVMRGIGALGVATLALPDRRPTNRLRDRLILSSKFGA
ncbi:MAG TPA: hypothetical protein VLH86_03105 [Patescibacteria group bacterium]|nr:hypothetical protein [Patescibacteria group bacterium]